jgi:hypothetical protein
MSFDIAIFQHIICHYGHFTSLRLCFSSRLNLSLFFLIQIASCHVQLEGASFFFLPNTHGLIIDSPLLPNPSPCIHMHSHTAGPRWTHIGATPSYAILRCGRRMSRRKARYLTSQPARPHSCGGWAPWPRSLAPSPAPLCSPMKREGTGWRAVLEAVVAGAFGG